jgi:dipeptidyl aminopeptidase/acylaminoacyl peptidase
MDSMERRWEGWEKELFPARGLPGGGQLEVRMTVSSENPDPDVLHVARRVKPYNLESWYAEWTAAAEENAELASSFEQEGARVTAHEYYRRATDFYRRALVFMAEEDSRMLPTYHVMKEMWERAWSLVPPPFERVQIPYEGETLDGLFYPVRGAAGPKVPVVFNYAGADGILIRGTDGEAAQYVRRGMAFLDVDGPGHGGALRVKKLYAPPDSERLATAVIDYLVSRPDVEQERIGIHGSSMGGYSAPRCATAEKRIKAVAVWSGAYSLVEDIFDYYPPIQERLRWLTGASDLTDARRKMAEFTLEGRAREIECPLLIGYSHDDRVMSPLGALRLYEEATNAKREMVDGVGHGEKRHDRRHHLVDWFARQLGTQ